MHCFQSLSLRLVRLKKIEVDAKASNTCCLRHPLHRHLNVAIRFLTSQSHNAEQWHLSGIEPFQSCHCSIAFFLDRIWLIFNLESLGPCYLATIVLRHFISPADKSEIYADTAKSSSIPFTIQCQPRSNWLIQLQTQSRTTVTIVHCFRVSESLGLGSNPNQLCHAGHT